MSVSTTDAVTARDFIHSTPAAPVMYDVSVTYPITMMPKIKYKSKN